MENVKNKKILIILVSFLVIGIILYIKDNVIFTNIINPLFWLCIILYFICNKNKIYIRFTQKGKYYLYSTIVSFFCIIAYFFLGIYFGFAKSPYNHSIHSVINNIYVQLVPIIGIEITRAFILIKNKENRTVIFLTTLLFILLEINYRAVIDKFYNKKEFFEYICQEIIPTIVNGIFYTYLTVKTLYISSLIYRTNLKLAILLTPILPNIDWFVSSSVKILTPTIIYFVYKYKFIRQREDARLKKQNLSYKVNYLITITLLFLLICFMIGTFKYEPITILSNSMSPLFTKGDVAIYKKLSADEIKDLAINSIIVYTKQDRNIMHRIVNKIEDGENTLFETKGDSNNKSDLELVQINQIKGVYVFHIKYIGYPSVWLYDYFNIE